MIIISIAADIYWMLCAKQYCKPWTYSCNLQSGPDWHKSKLSRELKSLSEQVDNWTDVTGGRTSPSKSEVLELDHFIPCHSMLWTRLKKALSVIFKVERPRSLS